MQDSAWSFVAMEYYALLLNRCFVLSIEGGQLRGVKCRGLTADLHGGGFLSRWLHRRWSVAGDRKDPSSYIEDDVRRHGSRADFAVPLTEISAVDYDPRRKWGMGEYPHNGRIRVTGTTGRREFIIVGRQSASDICARLRAAAGLARSMATTESA